MLDPLPAWGLWQSILSQGIIPSFRRLQANNDGGLKPSPLYFLEISHGI